jgi:hypothetical protein
VVYYGYLMKHQSFHRSQVLDAKVLNHEDVSEEREMIGSMVLDRQSAKPAENFRHLEAIRFRFSNRVTFCITRRRIQTNINWEVIK